MKLLTHNMLTSHVKGVTKGYPLLIKVGLVPFESLTSVNIIDVSINLLSFFCYLMQDNLLNKVKKNQTLLLTCRLVNVSRPNVSC